MNPVLARIQNYLELGGLFNPEMMEHDKVRELIMECRTEIERLEKFQNVNRGSEPEAQKIAEMREQTLRNITMAIYNGAKGKLTSEEAQEIAAENLMRYL